MGPRPGRLLPRRLVVRFRIPAVSPFGPIADSRPERGVRAVITVGTLNTFATKLLRRPPEGRDERGVSMLAIIMVVVILGLLVTIVLNGHGPSTTTTIGSAVNSTTTTAPRTVASGASEATVASCEANYAIVSAAVATYRALHGTSPPAGEAWATSHANGGPMLSSWPSVAKSYAIVWNGTSLSVRPVKGAASTGNFGTHSPASGCYALTG
jgi:hypothetical protein